MHTLNSNCIFAVKEKDQNSENGNKIRSNRNTTTVLSLQDAVCITPEPTVDGYEVYLHTGDLIKQQLLMFLCRAVLGQLCVKSSVLKDLLPRSDPEWRRGRGLLTPHPRPCHHNLFAVCFANERSTAGLGGGLCSASKVQREESGIIRGCVYSEDKKGGHILPRELTDSTQAASSVLGSQSLSLSPPLTGAGRVGCHGRLSPEGFTGAEPPLPLFIHVSLLWLGRGAAGHRGLSGVRCPVSPA